METPPLFELCKADSTVNSLLGDSEELRVFPFAYAEKKGFNLNKPYAVWQTVGGSPDNNLGSPPCSDLATVQIDVYANTGSEARAAANAIEKAIEYNSYITLYVTEDLEKDTQLFRSSFGATFIMKRA